jgi:hypothetical protein
VVYVVRTGGGVRRVVVGWAGGCRYVRVGVGGETYVGVDT